MAGGGGHGKPVWQGTNHPVNRINPQRPLYRFAATGLGAAMWFFVCHGSAQALQEANGVVVDVQSEEGWTSPDRLEAPMGSLSGPEMEQTTFHMHDIHQGRRISRKLLYISGQNNGRSRPNYKRLAAITNVTPAQSSPVRVLVP